MAPKGELLRYVAAGRRLVPDPEARLPGRGAYTCLSAACFERAAARGFQRALRRAVEPGPAPTFPENVHLDTE